MISQTTLQLCRSACRAIGYQNELIRSDCGFADYDRSKNAFERRNVPLAAFAGYPTDYRNSCIGFVTSTSAYSGAEWVYENWTLGAPLIIEIKRDKVQPWSIGSKEAKQVGAEFALADIERVFQSKSELWNPDSLSRVKSVVSTDPQLDFFDANLLSMLEEFFQPKLKNVLEKSFVQIQTGFKSLHGYEANIEQLFSYLFRFVTAKIFQDRRDVEGWADLSDPLTILRKATEHSSSQSSIALPDAFLDPQLLQAAWKSVSTTLNFENLSVPDLAAVYEDTFISATTRKELGVHSTPVGLADYIIEHLPWEQVNIEQRRVFEPFCGHGIFLARSLERLKRDVGDSTPQERHDYFRRMLVGVEKDALALEVCRLMLTLSDYPNNNSWQLHRSDVFEWPQWDETLASAGAVLANPPFEPFKLNPEERKQRGLGKAQKPTEMLRRLLRQPPPLLGLVLPDSFLNGPSYRDANRQIGQHYEVVSIIELPRIFNYAKNQTVALMGSGRREKGTSVSVSFAEVHKDKLQAFWDTGAVSNARTAMLEIKDENRKFSLWLAPEDSIVQWLPASLLTLSSLATIHQGIHWISRTDDEKKTAPRTDVASDTPKDGFMRGAEKMGGNLSQFQIKHLRYLSLLPEHQDPSTKANERSWEEPKVVCNAGRRGENSPWRITAWADEQGLAFTKQFFAVWPNEGISTFALAAILCSPIANAFVREKDRGRDNRKETLDQLPLPTKDKLGTEGTLHSQAQELQRLLNPAEFAVAPSDEQITEALMRLDAAVLDAYELSAPVQTALLKKFQGWNRPVSLDFDGYFPGDFTEEITLSDYIAVKYDWEKYDERRCELIEKDAAENSLSFQENEELQHLQKLADLWLALENPQPTVALNAFIEELKVEGKWIY